MATSPDSGFSYADALQYLKVAGAAVLGFFGAWFTGTVRLTKTATDVSITLLKEYQDLHAQDIARISMLQGEILELNITIRGLHQKLDSLLALVVRDGIAVPGTTDREGP